MAATSIRVAVVDAILEIIDHAERYDCTFQQAVANLSAGPAAGANLDFPAALDALAADGASGIDRLGDRQAQRRACVALLITRSPPIWRSTIYLGRELFRASAPENAVQCFQQAGLLNEIPTAEVIQWWTDMGQKFRHMRDDELLQIGREGELLTLELERRRLIEESIDREPISKFLDDNGAGYDVVSYVSSPDKTSVQDVLIEVKACEFLPLHFYLSRKQWELAREHGDAYRLDLWYLPTAKLLSLTGLALQEHVPLDRGGGEWQKVLVRLSSALPD